MGFFNRIRFLGIGLGLVLGLHFFLIGHFVESYPSWGDDWGFILLFDTQLSDVFYSFSSYLIPFHGGIHANLWAKLYVIFSSFFVSDFSQIIIGKFLCLNPVKNIVPRTRTVKKTQNLHQS